MTCQKNTKANDVTKRIISHTKQSKNVMYFLMTLQRIFQLTPDILQAVRKFYHVLFFVLLKYFQLNVKGVIPDVCQLLKMNV